MGTFLVSLITVSITFFYYGPSHFSAHWSLKWLVMMLFMALSFSIYVGKKIHSVLTPALFLTCFSSLWVSWYPSIYTFYSKTDRAVYGQIVGVTYAALTSVLFVTFFFVSIEESKKDWEKWLSVAFGWVCLSATTYTLLCRFFYLVGFDPDFNGAPIFRPELVSGPIGNPSMSGSLIAVTLPFVWGKYFKTLRPHETWWTWWKIGLLASPMAAVLLTPASVPTGVLAVVVTTMIARRCHEQFKKEAPPYDNKWEPRFEKLAVLLGICLIFAAIVYTGYILNESIYDHFFEDSGRGLHLKRGLSFLKEMHISKWKGIGLDESMIFLPYIDQLEYLRAHPEYINNGKTPYLDQWLWFHNDWFQAYFEGGFPIVLSYMAIALACLYRSFRRYAYFPSVCGFICLMWFNYPLHLPIHALFGAFLVWVCLRKKHEVILIEDIIAKAEWERKKKAWPA